MIDNLFRGSLLCKCRLQCEVIVLLPIPQPPLLLAVYIKCLILLMLMLSIPNGSKSIISGEMLLHWVALNVLGMRMAARASCCYFPSASLILPLSLLLLGPASWRKTLPSR